MASTRSTTWSVDNGPATPGPSGLDRASQVAAYHGRRHRRDIPGHAQPADAAALHRPTGAASQRRDSPTATRGVARQPTSLRGRSRLGRRRYTRSRHRLSTIDDNRRLCTCPRSTELQHAIKASRQATATRPGRFTRSSSSIKAPGRHRHTVVSGTSSTSPSHDTLRHGARRRRRTPRPDTRATTQRNKHTNPPNQQPTKTPDLVTYVTYG